MRTATWRHARSTSPLGGAWRSGMGLVSAMAAMALVALVTLACVGGSAACAPRAVSVTARACPTAPQALASPSQVGQQSAHRQPPMATAACASATATSRVSVLRDAQSRTSASISPLDELHERLVI